MARRRKHKGKRRKHRGGKRKHKAVRHTTSFRGVISYTPCRNPKGRFTRKSSCKR